MLKFINYILFVFLILTISVLIWSSNKGIDFSDESLYLLGYLYPEEIKWETRFFQHIVLKFFGFMDVTIVNLRLLRLVLTLCSGFFLAFCFIKWIKLKFYHNFKESSLNKVNITCLILISSLLGYTYGPQTISYNSISTVLLQLLCGILLLKISMGLEKTNFFQFFYSIIIGFLTAILFINKFPSFFLFLAIFAGIISFNNNFFSRKYLINISIELFSFCVGIFLLTLFYFRSWENFSTWFNDFTFFIKLQKDGGQSHDIYHILHRYYEDILTVIKIALIKNSWFIIPIGLILTLHFKSRFLLNFSERKLSLIIGFLLVAFVLLKGYYLGGNINSYQIIYFYIIIYAIFSVVVFSTWKIKEIMNFSKSREVVLIITLFLFIPLVGSFGSNNSLTVQFLNYMAFFICILLIIMLKIEKKILVYTISMVLILTCLIASSQIIYGVVLYPYRLHDNLLECKYPLPDPHNQKNQIMVDKQTADFIKSIDLLLQQKTNFKKGDPMFTFSQELGFIYLLQGKPLIYYFFDENLPRQNCTMLQLADNNKLDNTYFLLRKSNDLNSCLPPECFSKKGLNFERDFYLVGEVEYTFNNGIDTLQIYGPIKMIKMNQIKQV